MITGVARIFLAGLVFLSVWTLGGQIVALAGLPFWTLYLALAAGLVAGTAAALSGAAVSATVSVFDGGALRLATPAIAPWPTLLADRRKLMIAGVSGLLGLVAMGLQYSQALFLPLWLLGLAFAAIAVLYRPTAEAAPLGFGSAIPSPAGSAAWLALAATVVMTAFYLVVSIPDADDALFLNFATGAKATRDAVFTVDTMLGIEGLDFIKSTYRLEPWLLLNAVVSELTGLPVLTVAHGVLPLLLIGWSATALTLIHHALFGCYRAVGLALHLAALAALDGALQSYGFHALPRFFHGKAPLVTIIVPLIAVTTLVWLRQRRMAALAMTAFAIGIGVGFTANGVYAGPLTAALIGLVFLLVGGVGRWRVLALPLVIIWPAVMAAAVLLTEPPGPSEYTDAGTISGTLWVLAGTPLAMVGMMGLLLLAAAAALAHPALLAVSLYTGVLLVFVLNPFLWDLYGALVTGNLNYRLMWAVPVPLVITVIATAVWAGGNRWVRTGIAALALGGLVWPGSILWRVSDWATFPKVPAADFALARAVDHHALEGDLVLAPQPVATWVPVVEGAPAVVEARSLYIPQRLDPYHADILARRAQLFTLWNDRSGDAVPAAELRGLISATGVTLVLADTGSARHRAALPVLEEMGFRTRSEPSGYRILGRDR